MIFVSSPPWKTWWAYLCYALLALLIVRGFVYWRVAALQQHRLELAKQVEMRTQDLHQTMEELNDTMKDLHDAKINAEVLREKAQQASKAKSQFLANMSHEIRTPMNAILGFSQILENMIQDEKQKSYLESIIISGRSLLRLINDILDLSKVEAGKFDLEYKPVNCHDLIHDFKHIFLQKITEKGLDFFIETADDLPPALILDETRVRQIVFNLLGNAIKFTSEGHITLRAVWVKKSAALVDLIIEVEDSGIGIPDDQQDKIFGAFEQTSGQSFEQYGGTGLGLSISKKLSHLMNGELSVKSQLDRGSTFTLLLRGVEMCSLNDLPETETEGLIYNFKKSSLLIADDVPMNCELLCSYLQNFPFEMTFAGNGMEALKAVEKSEPDVVLMDYKMPLMNGLEATREIRKFSQVPIIIISASAMREDNDRIAAECSSFLSKPIERTTLLKELAKYLPHKVLEPQEDTTVIEMHRFEHKDFELGLLLKACRAQIKPLIEQWQQYPGSYDIMKDINDKLFKLVESYPHEHLIAWQEEYQQAFNNLKHGKG